MAGPRGKYNPETTPQLIFDLTLRYATDLEICKAIGISADTYYRWLSEKSELSDLITRAKRIRAQKLVPKLEKRAKGFSFTETTQERDSKSGEMVVTKKVRKTVPPDVAALKFFLTNGLPDEFKNKQELDHTGQIETGAQVLFYIPGNGRDEDASDDSE